MYNSNKYNVALYNGRLTITSYLFIDEPNVTIRPPIATSVTVVSPTNEYTAELSGIPAEAVVERRVEIDTGDDAVCELVANQLLGRWGREQVSITGVIAFNVGLQFKQLVRCRIPSAGLFGDFILQQKAHNLADFKTTVTIGDIMLSENELLARILQDLGG